MKNKKPAHIRFSYFNNEKMEQKLCDMAAQGWILTANKKGGFVHLCYRREEPQQLHYSIVPSPNVNQDARELDELCAAAGWELLAVKKRFRIYVNAQEDPVPIYTDPQDNMDKYKKFIWRRILTVGGLELAADAFFILWYAVSMRYELHSTFVDLIGYPLGFVMWTALFILLCLFLCYVAALLIPLWCGMHALKKGTDWERKVRWSEKSSRWVQIIAPLVLIPAALLACTDAIDLPYQHGDPPLTAMDVGYDGEIRWDYMTWDGPFCSFKRYLSLTPEYEWGMDEFFYVYIESSKSDLVKRLAENGIRDNEWIDDAPKFSRDGIDVYYFAGRADIYMVKDNQALYINKLPDPIDAPEMFDKLVDLFFVDHQKA